MSIKCIALDMDKTTLNAEGKLSEKNKEALKCAIKKGVHVVVASGRAFSALPADVMAVEGIDYAITSNGAEIYEVATGKCLKSYCISRESILKILELTKNQAVTWEVFIAGQAYASSAYVDDPVKFGASSYVVDYVKRTRKRIDDIYGFILEHAGELNSIDIIVKDVNLKERIWQQVLEEISDIYATSSAPQLMEISSKECGKHRGLAYILEYLGLSREEAAAFGDGDNDADMLKYAGIGVAVANASKTCIAVADMVVADYDDDGVAEGIYRILEEERV